MQTSSLGLKNKQNGSTSMPCPSFPKTTLTTPKSSPVSALAALRILSEDGKAASWAELSCPLDQQPKREDEVDQEIGKVDAKDVEGDK